MAESMGQMFRPEIGRNSMPKSSTSLWADMVECVYSDRVECHWGLDRLRQTNAFLQAALDAASEHVAVLDETGTIVMVNAAWRQFTAKNHGDPCRTGVGLNYLTICEEATGERADGAKEVAAGIREVLAQVRSEFVYVYPCHSHAERRWFRLRATRFTGLGAAWVMLTHVDISDMKQVEEQLRASLEEKEVLLKEIHHRVKNNLQVIHSLLDLQADYAHEPATRGLCNDSQTRIRSMALIHEILYQSRDLARVNFAEYAQRLTVHLQSLYGAAPETTIVTIRCTNIHLDINTAVPCGLILNELLTNALKYAFPDGQEGHITIDLQARDNGHLSLIVMDTGCGLPAGLDVQKTETLGLQLVQTLTEQLGGTLTVLTHPGTRFTIDFTPEALSKEVH